MQRKIVWAVAAILLAATTVWGQCPGGQCPSSGSVQTAPILEQPTWRASPQQPTPAWRYVQPRDHFKAVVRIKTDDGSMGSGVLVNYRGHACVLTNEHVVRDCRGGIGVRFASGEWKRARELARDATWDLAVLAIDAPPAGTKPAELQWGAESRLTPGDRLESCGWGPDGRMAVNSGRFKTYTHGSRGRTQWTDWMVISGRARGGDSGGPIFDRKGRVAGVLWGTDGKTVVGVQVGRIHRVLAKLFPARHGKIHAKRDDAKEMAGRMVPVSPQRRDNHTMAQQQNRRRSPVLPYRRDNDAVNQQQNRRLDTLEQIIPDRLGQIDDRLDGICRPPSSPPPVITPKEPKKRFSRFNPALAVVCGLLGAGAGIVVLVRKSSEKEEGE